MMKMGGGGIGRKGGISLASKQVSAEELRKKSDDLKDRQRKAAERVKAEDEAAAAAAAAESAPPEDPPPDSEPTDSAEATDSADSTGEPAAEAEPAIDASTDHPAEAPPEASPDGASGSFDLAAVIAQLGQLRAELRSRATEPEHDESVAAVGRAERALKKAQEEMQTAGQWAIDTAQELNLSAVAGPW